MRKRSGFTGLLCALVLAISVALSSCGGTAAVTEDSKAAFAGTWSISEFSSGGQALTDEELQVIKAMGIYLTLLEDGNAELGDFFADVTAESAFDAVDKADLSEALHKALATLTDRERQIIIFHYGLYNTACHTLVEIGNMFHLSRERIRQIEAEALTKLRLGDHMQLAAYA